MPFTPPPGAATFCETVRSRVLRLIDAGLWDIPANRFHGWMRGFVGEAEQYFAACLLDSLIYRTGAQFTAGLATIFHGSVVTACGLGEDDQLINLLKRRSPDPLVRLVPVICDADPPSKSGPMVMRRLAKSLRIRSEWTIWPWQVERSIREQGVRTIVMVDDFLGSGLQFEGFCRKEGLCAAVASARAVYAPVVAHTSGIRCVHKFWPELAIVSAETLTDDHGFFSSRRWEQLSGSRISAEEAKAFYTDLLPRTGFVAGDRVPALGVGELALCFGAAHGTPNNTLPILWHDQDDRWCGLLER